MLFLITKKNPIWINDLSFFISKNKVMPEACIMYLYTNLRHTLFIYILILYCSNIPYSIYSISY
ncbi:conserved domain protein [Phocaeicola vulgatus PC510]|uniref:Conserved domain protein n=1 Tax=Phocaeicola vulgatus PC510 TaxID=702446 RepID=D4V9W1_PHOVU|nr:conserved domain protein [Phocaeicola vulgatus PC510]